MQSQLRLRCETTDARFSRDEPPGRLCPRALRRCDVTTKCRCRQQKLFRWQRHLSHYARHSLVHADHVIVISLTNAHHSIVHAVRVLAFASHGNRQHPGNIVSSGAVTWSHITQCRTPGICCSIPEQKHRQSPLMTASHRPRSGP